MSRIIILKTKLAVLAKAHQKNARQKSETQNKCVVLSFYKQTIKLVRTMYIFMYTLYF